MEKGQIRVNVREVAEFYYESGDLESGRALIRRMLEGTRIHQKRQSGYDEGWRGEVPVKLTLERRGLTLVLDGRIDGLKRDETGACVEEIKTTYEDTAAMTGGEHPVHWAQAELYGAMLAENEALERVTVRLVYVNPTGSEAVFTRGYTREALWERLETYLSPLLDWLEALGGWASVSRASMTSPAFPFETYRAGQREMAANVYIALRDGENLLCQAPTGIGKTMAALFPALCALGEGRVGRVFFLTARSTGRLAAEQALDRLRGKWLRMRSVSITAKDTVCPMETRDCRSEVCPRARGYYDRRRAALYEALTLERLTREDIERLADKHTLGPFELSLDLAELAEVVICDYNYVFDPRVKLQRFFTGRSDAGLLIDEAHNLCPRVRDMLSGRVRSRELTAARREVGRALGRKHPLYQGLTALLAAIKAVRGDADEAEVREELPIELIGAVRTFVETCGADGSDETAVFPSELFFGLVDFIRAADAYDGHYRTLIEPEGRDGADVRLLCADPSEKIAAALKRVHGAALFSATLSPMTFYRDLLGLTEETGAMLDLPSPFPKENLLVMRYPLPLRYREREGSLERLCAALKAFMSAKKGNYLIGFPSYALMSQTLTRTDWPVRLLVQTRDMDEAARRDFLSRIEREPEETTAVCVVMGGAFAEGVDLPDNRLNGAAIVGTGVPQLSLEGDTLRALYEERWGQGYAYAYQYPGLARVFQAAGRVIRSETDRGAILLIDARWIDAAHRALMPPHWRTETVRDLETMSEKLTAFWNEER